MKQNLLCILLLFVVVISNAQSFDLEQFGQEQPLKLTGNLSANSVYYNSNQNSARDPFTYFLQGSLNVQWYSFCVLCVPLRFEVKEVIRNPNGEAVARVYDGFLENGGKVTKYELKNWSGWYPSTIRTQFIRDWQ